MGKIVTATKILGLVEIVGLAIVAYLLPNIVGFLAVGFWFVCYLPSLYIMWFGSERERLEAAEVAMGVPIISGLYCFFSFSSHAYLVLRVLVGTFALGCLVYLVASQRSRKEADG